MKKAYLCHPEGAFVATEGSRSPRWRCFAEKRLSMTHRWVNSNSSLLIITLVIMMVLTACGPASTPTAIPTITLGDENTPSNNNGSSDATSISASAVIVPVNDARLSFASVGKVTEVNVKVGDAVTTGQALVKLDTTILEAKVREAQANLEAAQAQVSFLKRNKTDQVHLDQANAEVERMQALLDSANATLNAQSALVAPFDGVIVSVDIAPAETVVPGQVVIVLGNFSRFQIETTDLSERDVTRVQLGQSVSVFIEALNEEFSGSVVDIDRIGSTLGGDVVFTVTVDFDNQPQGLLWGMSADVEIQTGE